MPANTHTHDGPAPHSHSHDHDHNGFNAAEHGHSHEILDGPGSYMGREMPIIEGRDWSDRAFTVGIGGYAPNRLPGSQASCTLFEKLQTSYRESQIIIHPVNAYMNS